ncbi:MAG: GAF domain-containing protein [Proteobacteria bacterium]|nr:GAF domain-containing protein [Pseudomonadota bacterium]
MDSNSLEKFLNVVGSVFDAYSSVLFLPDAGGGDGFALAAKFSLGDHIADQTVILPGQGLVGWILRNQKPLLINNFDRSKSHLGYYVDNAENNIKAFMGCPLPLGGALCLDSRRTYSFSDKDMKILDLFARLACDIKSSVFRADQGEAEQCYYSALQVISALRKHYPRWSTYLGHFLGVVSQTTGFSSCFLAERDELGKSYFLEGVPDGFFPQGAETPDRLPIKSGLIGWVFSSGQPMFSGEKDCCPAGQSLFGRNLPTPPLKSLVLLPLMIHKKTRGVLVMSHTDLVPVTPSMKTFVEMASDNLSLFLENLYLRTRLAHPGK